MMKDLREKVIKAIEGLDETQLEIIWSIVERFVAGSEGELLSDQFLSNEGFDFFSARLSAHHAYSTNILKKENFEHILFQIFKREKRNPENPESMTNRGWDLKIDGTPISIKTEAARNLNWEVITISKLMEAAWIRNLKKPEEIPGYIKSMIIPHFDKYEEIYILRANPDPKRFNNIRYELREIPKHLFSEIENLTGSDFSQLTEKNSTRAKVMIGDKNIFDLRLDGSVEKVTINRLDVGFCPLHAWWSLKKPD